MHADRLFFCLVLLAYYFCCNLPLEKYLTHSHTEAVTRLVKYFEWPV